MICSEIKNLLKKYYIDYNKNDWKDFTDKNNDKETLLFNFYKIWWNQQHSHGGYYTVFTS